MIDPGTIANRLQQALGNPELALKAKRQERHLMILVERPADLDLDYEALSSWFVAAIQSMPGVQVDLLSLYSRPRGEKKPDWQEQRQISPQIETRIVEPEPEPEAEATPEPDAGLDLSSYCFVRNQLLLRTSLPLPPGDIQQQIRFFHELSDEEKQRLLPMMTEFFKTPDMALPEDLTSAQHNWFEQMQLHDEQKFKTISIWLSRYCADPEKALRESQPASPTPSASSATSPDLQAAMASPPPGTYTAQPQPIPQNLSRSQRITELEDSGSSDSSMVLSIVCHLSVYFLPLIVPIIIYLVASDEVTRGNAIACLKLYLGQFGYSFLASMFFFINGYLGIAALGLLLLYGLVMPIVATIVCATNPGTVFKYPFMPQ